MRIKMLLKGRSLTYLKGESIMKRTIWLMMVLVLCFVGVSFSADAVKTCDAVKTAAISVPPTIPTSDPGPIFANRDSMFDLGKSLGGSEISVRSTFVSKYKWYGVDRFDGKGAMGLGVNYQFPKFDSLDSYVGFDYENWSPLGSNSNRVAENASQNTYKVYYVQNLWAGERYNAQVTVSGTYYDLTEADNGENGQEFGVGIAFPELFNWGANGKLVPSAYYGRVWDLALDAPNKTVNKYSGDVYVGGLDYYKSLSDNMLLDVYAKVNYSDGLVSDDSEFTDGTVGVLTDIKLAKGTTVTPFVNYVYYFDQSLLNRGNADGEVWGGVTLRFNF